MSKNEMVKRSRQALEEFDKLPPAEQFRQMAEWGTVDENGEVILGQDEVKKVEAARAAEK